MDPYLTAKWLHILSSTVLFGTGMGTAFQMVWTMRTGRVETIHSVAWAWWWPIGFSPRLRAFCSRCQGFG